MPSSNILYQANQEVFGKHIQSKEWIFYSGKLTIYERKVNPVILKLKCETNRSFITDFMDQVKEFKGKSVTEVYGKMSRWYYRYGIIFQY
jgi:hypothetical protein